MRTSHFFSLAGALVLLEGASYLGWLSPTFGVFAFLFLIIVVFLLALLQPYLAVSAVVIELILGGKGYLFTLPIGNEDVSFRMGVFIAVFIGMVIHALRQRSFWGSQWSFRWVWLSFAVAAGWASIVGVLRGNGVGNVFEDANAYLYLALVPLFGSLRTRREFQHVLWAAGAAVLVMALKTGVVQGLYNHVPSTSLTNLYRWIRDTRVGEITWIIGRLYRVFFQSHIWGMLAFFVGIGMGVQARTKRWLWTLIAGLGAYVVLVSLSRSFWLGTLAAGTFALVAILFRRSVRQCLARVVLVGASALLIAYLGYMWTLNFPRLWGGGGGGGSVVRTRTEVTAEPAASSRRALLPVMHHAILQHSLAGNGFGTALTYNATDPRVNTSKSAQGTAFTTRAFELGYHGFGLHFGLPLTFVLLGALAWLLWRGITVLRLEHPHRAVVAGLWVATLGLCVTHLTTPYLNHPLGFGMLMLAATGFALYDPRHGQR